MKNNNISCAAAGWLRAIVGAIAFAPLFLHAAAPDDMKQMLESGRAADAYALAKQHPELLGDPAFDFYLGVAAGETGHAGEAVLALERYILQYPENIAARLQLARAYFVLGEDARAKEEFEALLALNPPADARATIDRFLEAVRLRETRYKVSSGLYIEAGIGTDSNVNGGPSDPNLFLPNLGPVVLAQSAARQGDRFAEADHLDHEQEIDRDLHLTGEAVATDVGDFRTDR